MKSLIFKPWKAAWIAGMEPGTRFMTRRPVKPQPNFITPPWLISIEGRPFSPGDTGYVRETWWADGCCNDVAPRDLRDDVAITFDPHEGKREFVVPGKTRVSIHLSERFARSFFKVIEVGVQRVQEITDADGRMEGMDHYPIDDRTFTHEEDSDIQLVAMEGAAFEVCWQSMYAGTNLDWQHNPWSWIYTLEKLEGRSG